METETQTSNGTKKERFGIGPKLTLLGLLTIAGYFAGDIFARSQGLSSESIEFYQILGVLTPPMLTWLALEIRVGATDKGIG